MGKRKKSRSFVANTMQVAGDGTQTKKGVPGVCRVGSGKKQVPDALSLASQENVTASHLYPSSITPVGIA